MKAKDLMIGDWVSITEPDDFHGYVGKVVIVNNETGYVTVHIPSMHMHDVLCDDLQPIPLTSEILNRNDFCDSYKDSSLAKDGVFKWHNMYGHCVTVDMNTNTIKIQHDCRMILDLSYNMVVPVHELQHALKLCGIEKDIEL